MTSSMPDPQRAIRTRGGESLSHSIGKYNQSRGEVFDRRSMQAVCYAPFLSMDFDATGAVRLCNHSHSEIARVTPDSSLLDIWRGAAYRQYRREFSDYVLDEKNCPHCVRQCRSGSGAHVFATEQFDGGANDEPEPLYPKRLIFRLRNTCNLACIMCDGQTSSRIRKDRDRLPLQDSAYGERFFEDMAEIVPHLEHVEFYGGEPFLVKEHVRIFEMLREQGANCTIYVNTNGVSVNSRAREFLENLNFKTIAVSMDAVSDGLHGDIRTGMRNGLFRENFDYFLDLRARRGVDVMLNVTEHRKNWFELPEVFRFANDKDVYLHVNTCIHPHNVTLYTLPTNEVEYVLEFFRAQRKQLLADLDHFRNLANYDFLISLVQTELEGRSPDWAPEIHNRNGETDGWLAAPRPGLAPFAESAQVVAEIDRILRHLAGDRAARSLASMLEWIESNDLGDSWGGVVTRLRRELAALPEVDAVARFQ